MQDPAQSPKPREVAWAVRAIWASLVLGFANFLLDYGPDGIAPGPEDWIIACVSLGVLGALAATLAAGHNWARHVYLALFVIGSIPSILLVGELFTRGALNGALALVQMLLQAAAAGLLYTRPARAWFRRGRLQ